MFGLEKGPNKDNKKGKMFEFDLEKEFKANPGSKAKLDKEIDSKILELKDLLRKGMDSDDEFEAHGVLLRGYAAFKKVLNRIGK